MGLIKYQGNPKYCFSKNQDHNTQIRNFTNRLALTNKQFNYWTPEFKQVIYWAMSCDVNGFFPSPGL